MLDSIFTTDAAGETAITTQGLLISLAASVILGMLISMVYSKASKKVATQDFALTLVMLPAVVTVIILLVGSNIARAFSLAGAFSIIRFRSAPGGPKDITYVLFTMAVGLACGMGYVFYAAIVAVLLCGLMALLEFFHFGQPKTGKMLRISIPEDLDYENAFNGVWGKYTLDHDLVRVKTTNLGSLYELQYKITTKEHINEKAFVDELRCRNGNLNITLNMQANEGEF